MRSRSADACKFMSDLQMQTGIADARPLIWHLLSTSNFILTFMKMASKLHSDRMLAHEEGKDATSINAIGSG